MTLLFLDFKAVVFGLYYCYYYCNCNFYCYWLFYIIPKPREDIIVIWGLLWLCIFYLSISFYTWPFRSFSIAILLSFGHSWQALNICSSLTILCNCKSLTAYFSWLNCIWLTYPYIYEMPSACLNKSIVEI